MSKRLKKFEEPKKEKKRNLKRMSQEIVKKKRKPRKRVCKWNATAEGRRGGIDRGGGNPGLKAKLRFNSDFHWGLAELNTEWERIRDFRILNASARRKDVKYYASLFPVGSITFLLHPPTLGVPFHLTNLCSWISSSLLSFFPIFSPHVHFSWVWTPTT